MGERVIVALLILLVMLLEIVDEIAKRVTSLVRE
jgi:hypothetical protein